MGKIIGGILLFVLTIVSCKKDKTTPVCEAISIESGEKTRIVGTWIWYKTTVEEWFDLGPSVYHEYTPQTQGLEYYFTISETGEFKEYRNDTLIQTYLLSTITYEEFQGNTINGITFKLNCGDAKLHINQYIWNIGNDSIMTREFPYYFDDEENHLRSKINYFVRE